MTNSKITFINFIFLKTMSVCVWGGGGGGENRIERMRATVVCTKRWWGGGDGGGWGRGREEKQTSSAIELDLRLGVPHNADRSHLQNESTRSCARKVNWMCFHA